MTLLQKTSIKATLTSNQKRAVQFNEDGTFIYTPQNKDVEEDHFTYQIMHDLFFMTLYMFTSKQSIKQFQLLMINT